MGIFGKSNRRSVVHANKRNPTGKKGKKAQRRARRRKLISFIDPAAVRHAKMHGYPEDADDLAMADADESYG